MATQPDPAFYPLGDDKIPIPFDILRAVGTFIQAFTDVSSGQLTLSSDDCIVIVFSTARVLLRWGTVAPSRTQGAVVVDQVFIPANTLCSIRPSDAQFKIMAADVSSIGTLYMQVAVAWKGLSKDALRKSY